MKWTLTHATKLLSVVTIILVSGTGCENDEEQAAIKDGDGNIYTTVNIGTQVWLKENLITTSYFNGERIPNIGDNETWHNLATPAWCLYNNISAEHGHLYNWYAVNTGRICPQGFHVPTKDDWDVLTANLGGKDVAGGKLKEPGTVNWKAPNEVATPSSGFMALPGGVRGASGSFGYFGTSGHYWSSTERYDYDAWEIGMGYSNTWLQSEASSKRSGLSVRCIKN